MIVADASVIAPTVVDDGVVGDAMRQALGHATTLHAPDLMYLEALLTIRRARRARLIDEERALVAIDLLAASPVTAHPHRALLGYAWKLRDCCSAYDAAYVALAIALEVPLLTADRRLARAVSSMCQVELVTSTRSQ